MTNDEQTAADVQLAVVTMRTTAPGSAEWGNARAFLCRLLEADLKHWIKEHPPTVLSPTTYEADDPHRAVMLYGDNLLPGVALDTLRDILYENQASFIKIAKNTIAALKSKRRKSTSEAVATKYPSYTTLLKKIREAKKAWNTEDANIRGGESFRMMGGLARLGSQTGAHYSQLVKEAQAMEKDVLGHIVTAYTRADS